MMGLYRCQNGYCSDDPQGRHIFNFEVPEGQKVRCPKCGTATDDPQHGDVIVRLSILHFDPPSKIFGRGQRIAACNPKLRIGSHNGKVKGTGEPLNVNCPACKETEVFQKALHEEKFAVNPEHDWNVELDPKNGVVRVQQQ